MTGDRERDAAGRPRNARPRDASGRPLPRGAPDAGREPEEPLPPGQALDRGCRLLAQGQPFRAHEVFEAVWKAAPAGEQAVWRGLAQVAVGLTHHQRGNTVGAVALLRRGAERLEGSPGSGGPLHDPRAVATAARRAAELIEAQDPEETPKARSTSRASSESSAALAAIITELVSSISASASSS